MRASSTKSRDDDGRLVALVLIVTMIVIPAVLGLASATTWWKGIVAEMDAHQVESERTRYH